MRAPRRMPMSSLLLAPSATGLQTDHRSTSALPSYGLSLRLGSKQTTRLCLLIHPMGSVCDWAPNRSQVYVCSPTLKSPSHLSPTYTGYILGNGPLSHFLLPFKVNKGLSDDKSVSQEWSLFRTHVRDQDLRCFCFFFHLWIMSLI